MPTILFRRLFRRPAREEVSAELKFHIDMRVRDLVAHGMTAADAEAQVRAGFTNRGAVAAECVSIAERTARRTVRREYLDDLRQDARFALRQLVRAPAFTVGVVLTLALGIGTSTTVFSLLDAIFWRWPAGVSAPATVQRVWTVDHSGPGGTESGSSDLDYPRYQAIAAAAPSATALYSVTPDATLQLGAASIPAHLGYATAGLFPLLGAHAALGRIYGTAEDRMGAAAPVIVVSERFWRNALGGNAGIVGSRLEVARTMYTVIGVVAAPFVGPDLEAVDAWVPFGGYPGVSANALPWWDSRNYSGFQMLIRPARDSADPSFDARATQALRRADSQFGSADSTVRVTTGSLIAAQGPGYRAPELAIAVRLGGVALMLFLIVLANVLGLMLSRAVRRRHEIAMRLALGIDRSRLARLLLTESAMLALLAGAAAVVATIWGGALLRTLLFPGMQWAAAPIHWHVLAFAGIAAAFVAIVAGLVPLLHLLRSGTRVTIREKGHTGRGSSRLRGIAVATQVALSTVLLVGAALFVASLRNVEQLPIGYDADRLLYAAVRPNGPTDESALNQRVAAIVASFAAASGVERTSHTSAVPVQRGGFGIPWYVGQDSMGARASFRPTGSRVDPGYFATAGLVLVAGTDLQTGAHDVVINETMARTIWSGRSPLGDCIRFGTRAATCHTVVGVVRDAKRSSIVEKALPQYFIAADDADVGLPGADYAVIRARPDRVAAIAAALQQRLALAFPDARISLIPLQQSLDTQYRPWRLGALLFSVFGVLALVIASIGIYSTVSYDVAQRTRDFGIRAALGARLGDIVAAVLRTALTPVVAGVAIGVIAAILGGHLVAALLYGILPGDIRALVTAAALLLLVAALAALLPARRASRVDPLVALREE